MGWGESACLTIGLFVSEKSRAYVGKQPYIVNGWSLRRRVGPENRRRPAGGFERQMIAGILTCEKMGAWAVRMLPHSEELRWADALATAALRIWCVMTPRGRPQVSWIDSRKSTYARVRMSAPIAASRAPPREWICVLLIGFDRGWSRPPTWIWIDAIGFQAHWHCHLRRSEPFDGSGVLFALSAWAGLLSERLLMRFLARAVLLAGSGGLPLRILGVLEGRIILP